MDCVDEQIQKYLIDLPSHTQKSWEIRIKVCFHNRRVLPLAACNGHRTLDRPVDINFTPADLTWMRELFHGTNNRGHAIDAIQRLFD